MMVSWVAAFFIYMNLTGRIRYDYIEVDFDNTLFYFVLLYWRKSKVSFQMAKTKSPVSQILNNNNNKNL